MISLVTKGLEDSQCRIHRTAPDLQRHTGPTQVADFRRRYPDAGLYRKNPNHFSKDLGP